MKITRHSVAWILLFGITERLLPASHQCRSCRPHSGKSGIAAARASSSPSAIRSGEPCPTTDSLTATSGRGDQARRGNETEMAVECSRRLILGIHDNLGNGQHCTGLNNLMAQVSASRIAPTPYPRNCLSTASRPSSATGTMSGSVVPLGTSTSRSTLLPSVLLQVLCMATISVLEGQHETCQNLETHFDLAT